jgi:hypothetical protein
LIGVYQPQIKIKGLAENAQFAPRPIISKKLPTPSINTGIAILGTSRHKITSPRQSQPEKNTLKESSESTNKAESNSAPTKFRYMRFTN